MLKHLILTITFAMFSNSAYSEICQGFGPQTPRDLTVKSGTNPVDFVAAPPHGKMNLCNIHFHKNAEHKASGFSIAADDGKFGGWKCNQSPKISKEKLKSPAKNSCKNLNVGDTIEVHWVYSSCSVKPGKGLAACSSEACANPQLRVESKAFIVVNDAKALDFRTFSDGGKVDGFFQAKSLPDRSDALQFLGSTTGPNYSAKKCSPIQVTWNVSQSCEAVDIGSLSEWCGQNSFQEDGAHGVRPLVTEKALLDEI